MVIVFPFLISLTKVSLLFGHERLTYNLLSPETIKISSGKLYFFFKFSIVFSPRHVI